MIKKDKSRANPESTTISTLLGRDTSFDGTLSFKDSGGRPHQRQTGEH
jgi:hypothetical protein